MKRILLSLAILGIVGVIVTGATTAIFSDEEISSGNTFTAGAVDLGIDNHSYYNGNECRGGVWQGNALYPEPGTECALTWRVDYDIEHDEQGESEIRRFFDYDDLKPGDWGEDTISLHVNNNDAYLCVDVTLTSDNDNDCTEPEEEDGDVSCGDPGEGEGELDSAVNFYWWADDGDNVYEDDEGPLLPAGNLGQLGLNNTATVSLADSEQNIWNEGLEPGPLPGDNVVFIGKAWCFGNSAFEPWTQDDGNQGSGPDERPFDCDGAPLDNETQTDSFTLDISFQAVQSRNNPDFFCQPQEVRAGLITITKDVVNEGGGTGEITDFPLFVGAEPVESGVQEQILAGDYVVSETNNSGENYETTFGGDCDSGGNVTVPADGSASCTVTNTFVEPGSITVDKSVSFSDEILAVTIGDFDLFLDDGNGPFAVSDEVAETGLAPGTYTVSEAYTGGEDILFDAIFTLDCSDDGQTGTVTLGAGEDLTCDVENEITPDV